MTTPSLQPTPLKLGFIGLGIMGAPMAGHLLKAGHTLFVHTRSKVHPDLTAARCAPARRRWPSSPT